MNTLDIHRLGKIVAGDERTDESEGDKSGPISLRCENIPVPIVLWNGETPSKVLYLRQEVREITGTFRQKIDCLYSSENGLKRRLKSLVDGFPITFSAHDIFQKKDERAMNVMNDFFVQDVNGDGTDELIIMRKFGEVEVYDRDKRIFRYRPDARPDLFEYTLENTFELSLANHDEMFFTWSRRPYDSVATFSEADKRYEQATAPYRIVRLSPSGFTEIVPRFDGDPKPDKVLDVAALNKPGSKEIDELVFISSFENETGYYLSRHTIKGDPLDKPRKIYNESYNPTYYGLHFFPQCDQLLSYSPHSQGLLFFSPDKPMNWIKKVRLKDITQGHGDADLLDQKKIDGVPVALIEHDNILYAIDSTGKYRTSLRPQAEVSEEPVALATIKPVSDRHTIVSVQSAGPDMAGVVVIQSREPKMRDDLSLEELEKAGEMFLSDDEYRFCRGNLKIEYNEDTNEFAEWYCEKNKIPMPEIASLEDIIAKLPGYYDEMIKESVSSYKTSLRSRLFYPISHNDYHIIDEDDYKDKNQYKRWLNEMFVPPELVISIYNLKYGTISSQALSGYYYENMDNRGVYLPQINIRASGDHGQAFLVLRRKILDLNFDPSFYTIKW